MLNHCPKAIIKTQLQVIINLINPQLMNLLEGKDKLCFPFKTNLKPQALD